MKKLIAVLLLFLFCLPIITLGQLANQDSSLKGRNLQQQLFAAKYVKEYQPENGFDTPNQVLNFMKELSGEWQQVVSNQSEVYKRINSYVPMWAVHTLFNTELPNGSECLVYSEMTLPAFIKDVAFLKSQLQKENTNLSESAFIISMANLDWAVTQLPTYKCDLNKTAWQNLKNAIAEYPEIVQSYLDKEVLPSTKTEQYRKSYQNVLAVAKAAQTFIKLQNKIYQNELSELFTRLAAEFPTVGNYRYIYVEVAKNLWEKYNKRNETDLAFATLDLLARNTSEETLSRNKLRSMYAETDPRLGPTRFESINISNSSSLTLSEEKQRLSGKYFDAQKGKYVQLNIPNDQLVLLDFWSVGCGPCIDEIPKLNDLAKKYDDKIRLISINNDLLYGSNKEKLEEFVADHNIQYPVILDTNQKNLMNKFGVSGWPARFLLNKEGYFLKEPVENRIKLSLSEIERYLKEN
jgi:thiol-disulfide isomerase/thioredoxin